MFGIGAPELVVLFVIALFVLGPERLPGLARDIGKVMSELRRASDELTGEFVRADQPPRAVAPPPAPTPTAAAQPEPASAPAPPEPTPARASEETAPAEPSLGGEASLGEEPSVGDEPTAFDQQAQADADRARERGELGASPSSAGPPSEAERWG
jgi:Sec-independent protein translocase protein TatA